MTDQITEQLSALMDDELPRDEGRFLLKRLEGSEELRASWGRYHLIGDLMRGEMAHSATGEVARRVRAKIDSEPALKTNLAPLPVRWLKPLAGVAIAASVAAGVVFIQPMFSGVQNDSDIKVAVTAPPLTYLKASGTHWKNLARPGIESKLNRYLVDHNEFASPNGMSGVLPYSTFVTYDTSR